MSALFKGSKPGLSRNNTVEVPLDPAPSSQTSGAEKPQCQPCQSQALDCPADGEEAALGLPITPTPEKTEVTYPEGGLKAWLVVFGSFSGMVAGFGYMNSIGIYQAFLATHQLSDYSESSIGWVFSVYVFLSFFCSLQIGPIFDAHGPRFLILGGSVTLLLSVFLMGSCTSKLHLSLLSWLKTNQLPQSFGTLSLSLGFWEASAPR